MIERIRYWLARPFILLALRRHEQWLNMSIPLPGSYYYEHRKLLLAIANFYLEIGKAIAGDYRPLDSAQEALDDG